MKKLPIVLCAALVFATPAWAEVTYTPVDPTSYDFGIGIYDPTTSMYLNTVFVDPAYPSDTFAFTFAIHMNAGYWYWADSLHFSFVYDNSSIDVVAMMPIGPWHVNNYEGMEWPNTSHGVIAVASLTQGITTGPGITFPDTEIVPFMRVYLHVKSEVDSQTNPFGITLPGFEPPDYGMTFFSTLDPMYNVYPEQWSYFGGIIHEVPEPATLLVGGMAVLLGGVLRRRR